MVNALIELAVGWFVTYRVAKIVGAKGKLAIVIKVIGVLLMIAGVISFTHLIFRF